MRGVLRCLVALALLASGDSQAQARSWSIQVPDGPTVSYRGLASFDQAGQGAGAMLYPAPSLVGFAAALITHGLILEGVKSSERAKIQEKADEVLKPFRTTLDAFTPAMLFDRGMQRLTLAEPKRLVPNKASAGSDWMLVSAPEFAMTQDKRAIVLDNTIIVYRDGARDTPAYANVIRIVSAPLESGTSADERWTDKDGDFLKELSASLWAESVDIAVLQATAAAPSGVARTIRYREGGLERIERAEVLNETCLRRLIRTLRGELVSVPHASPPVSCTPPGAPGS